ncbi:MAG: RNA polymerase sigma factor, partial [Burkholderiaceae bacterium]
MWSLQPDAVLCTAASHGNELAFGELYRRHYPSLRAFVFHLLGARHRHEDSEDVVQDAFARAFDAISEGRFAGDFRRWIFTIARNRSMDLLRGERVRLVSLDADGIDSAPHVASEATTPVAMAETRDEVAWLVAAIDRLPERQRSALLLRELAGLSHTEIAETLDTTTASARQLITRARDGVRDAAERDGRERESQKRRSLRRELLDAAPALPFAAFGAVASAGSTAGGSIAFGKLVATLLAAMVLAGTASEVGRQVA